MSPASVLSAGFIRSYWITMRPYLLFVSGITGLAGLSFAPALSVPETVILFFVFFLSYGFGQALTDCFQTDTDAISAPYRPLVQGIVVKRDVAALSLGNLLVCGLVLGYFAVSNFILALLCVTGLATYTYFKRRWWGGPFYNGWIVALLFLIGYNSGSETGMRFSHPLAFALIAVLFGYANFVLVGYFKDVDADRQTGYDTFVVEFGRTAAAFASDLIAAVFVTAGAAAVLPALIHRPDALAVFGAGIFFSASVGVSLYTQVQLHHVASDREAYKAVAPSVHTYILMCSAIAAANAPDWIVPLAIIYACFNLVISIRPEISQV